MKTRKNFTLSDQAIEALSYLESQTHQSSSAIIEDLILTAAAGGNIPEQTLQLFDKRYSNWQKGLLLSSRQTERYCFQMIEMLNSMFLNLFDKDQEQFFPTHRYELEIDRANGNYDPLENCLAKNSAVRTVAEFAEQHKQQSKDNMERE